MKINSFEEACEKKGLDPRSCLPNVSGMPLRHQKAMIATAKITIIADASREKDPDWNNSDEEKWFPWFDMEVDKNNPTGFRFYGVDYGLAGTFVTGGSRHCYNSREEAEFHGKRFEDLYRDMMVLVKE